MFARIVSVQMKPNAFAEYSKVLASDVLPFFKKQRGFLDLLTFNGEDDDLVAISLWDSKESAVAFAHGDYPHLLKMVEKFVEGPPRVRIAELVQSTLHNLQATRAA
jgi:heme-degrading monooxygenase HmoA